jgi:2-polyprenyl-6-methoxyphenol hydroxylase-like FAD-dependent oxidoreductase
MPSVLPHRGAGANSAIEDAEAISHYLKGVSRSGEDIHAALQRAFRVRFRRTARFQLISRREGIQGPAPTQKSVVEDMSYFGAARWEMERPDMVLKKGEPVTFELRE